MVGIVSGEQIKYDRGEIDLLLSRIMKKYGFKKVKIKDIPTTLFKKHIVFHSAMFSESNETHNMEIEFMVDRLTYKIIQVTILNRSSNIIKMVKEDITKFIEKGEKNNMVKTESIVKKEEGKIIPEVKKGKVSTTTTTTPEQIHAEIRRSNNTITIPIKYFEGATELEKISQGDWIDVYARKNVFVPFLGQAMVPLGFAMELPKGMEGHLAPRSSTMKSWGMIQTNSVGIVDSSFAGDNDEWQFPVQCTMPHECIATQIEGHKVRLSGTWIRKGDKVAQFRIVDNMKDIKFIKVETLGNADRGMEGSTGTTKLNK